MELFRTRTQERGCERLFCGIGVDTRMSRGERETKDQLEMNCSKRKKARRYGRAGLWLGWRHATGGLGGQCDGLMHLLAQRAMMMIMRMMIHTTRDS